jgi:hypothetical protein
VEPKTHPELTPPGSLSPASFPFDELLNHQQLREGEKRMMKTYDIPKMSVSDARHRLTFMSGVSAVTVQSEDGYCTKITLVRVGQHIEARLH